MILFLNKSCWLAVILVIGQLVLGNLPVSAQVPSNREPVATNATNAIALRFDTPRCPIEIFRELLAMDPEQQEKFLAGRTNRDEILAKVGEYRDLDPDQRELKLKATELRWYLQRLMDAPATNRPALLARVPEKDRKLVEVRLRYWENLPTAAKRELQTNEAARSYFSIPPEQRILSWPIFISLAPIDELSAMTEEQRQKVLGRFDRWFTFTPAEKERILSTLSEPERRQIDQTLKKFAGLLPSQRSMCIRSFAKFTSLSPEEQQQFLKNAERWKQMTPTARQEWKDLVETLSVLPPFPSELDLPPPPPPSSFPVQFGKPGAR